MLTRQGLAAIVGAGVLYLAGLWFGYPFLFVLATALVVALGVGAAFLRRGADLEVGRVVSPATRITAGEDVHVTLRVTNRASTGLGATTLLEPIGSASRRIDVPRLASGATTTLEYDLTGLPRGRYPLGPLTADRTDPFGFFVVLRPCGDASTLWVRPRVHAIDPLASGRLRDLDGPAVDKALEGTVTFHGLREYVLGDDRRHIHWRTSARTGTLMVKQHVDVSEPRTAVVLDTEAARYDGDRFEVALEVAASVVAASARQRFPVALYDTSGARVTASRDHTAAAALDVLAAATVTPTGGVGRVASVLHEEDAGTSLVVVTGRLDHDDLAVLGAVRRRFDSVVAVVVAAPGAGPVAVPAGVRGLEVASGEEFALGWRALR